MVPLLICCSLLLLLWGSVFALCYVMHCFVSFLVFNHLYERERERAVCSTLFAFLVSCDCYVALSHEALELSAVFDCVISWSYSLVFFAFII